MGVLPAGKDGGPAMWPAAVLLAVSLALIWVGRKL